MANRSTDVAIAAGRATVGREGARRLATYRQVPGPAAEDGPLQGELLTPWGRHDIGVEAYLALGRPGSTSGVPRSIFVDLFA